MNHNIVGGLGLLMAITAMTVQAAELPLADAAEKADWNQVRRLIGQDVDPNTPQVDGMTSLHWAAWHDDQRSGFTPLHAITWVRKPNLGDGVDGDPPPIGSGNVTSLQFVRKLVEHGADINARLRRGRSGRGRLNHTGATPFLLAADTADVPLMRLLLELGADATLMNADHCPPFAGRCRHWHAGPG